MKRINEPRPDYPLRLEDIMGAEGWGTSRGAQAFGKINLQLLRVPERTLVVLQFAGVLRADVSFLREALVEILRKFRPRLLFIASALANTDLQANLESALILQGESLLLRRGRGEPLILGKQLPKEHEE